MVLLYRACRAANRRRKANHAGYAAKPRKQYVCGCVASLSTGYRKTKSLMGIRVGAKRSYGIANIHSEQDRSFPQFLWRYRFVLINANIARVRVLRCHLPEWIFYDTGRIAANAEFKIQDSPTPMRVNERRIPFCGAAPTVILHEAVVASKIHRHRLTANRTDGNEFRRDPHILLLSYHLPHGFFIIIGFLMARFAALP